MYDRGFYGGKFLPFHNGHKYCIRFAAERCNSLVVILFLESEEEARILNAPVFCGRELLSEQARIAAVKAECAKYKNVGFRTLNCRVMHRQALLDGTDVWDAETPWVMKTVGAFQAVFSSEPGYDAYFRRAYPFAEHILIDVPRIHVPISATKIRGMDSAEAEIWIKDPITIDKTAR